MLLYHIFFCITFILWNKWQYYIFSSIVVILWFRYFRIISSALVLLFYGCICYDIISSVLLLLFYGRCYDIICVLWMHSSSSILSTRIINTKLPNIENDTLLFSLTIRAYPTFIVFKDVNKQGQKFIHIYIF